MPSSSMTPEVYEQKRNELVTLLDEVLALLDNIPVLPANRDKTRDELQRTRRRVFENQFTIALMSHFQGGKSTTFNALCDGMEISPRGMNTETSATVITTQNTTDVAEAGKATIQWREPRDLALVFVDIILPYLRKNAAERFSECATAVEVAESLDFKRDMPVINNALQNEWDKWRKNKHAYSSSDALRIGIIICKHIFSPEIAALKEREYFDVTEIAPLVRFPDNWGPRFVDGDASVFDAGECAFAFIHKVCCKVQSRNLARTGSVIIDCPGLSGSRYAAHVTSEILEDVDAVWFLSGGKQLAQSELAMIAGTAGDKPERIFLTINMKETTRKNIVETIQPRVVSDIKQYTNVMLRDGEPYLYHALLALCSVQANRLLGDGLDMYTNENILDMYRRMNDEEAESTAEALTDVVKNLLSNLKPPEWRTFTGLDDNGIEYIRAASGLDGVVNAIEEHMIGRKAKSILIDNGVERAEKELLRFEGELEALESDVKSSRDAAENEYRNANEALKKFKEFVEKRMKELNFNDDIIDTTIADDYWKNVMLAAIDGSALSAAKAIHNMPARRFIFNPTQDDMKDAVTNAYDDEMRKLSDQWESRIRDGRNQTYNKTVGARVKILVADAEKEWTSLSNCIRKLNGLPELEFGKTFSLSGVSLGEVRKFSYSIWRLIGYNIRKTPLIKWLFSEREGSLSDKALQKTSENIKDIIAAVLLDEKNKNENLEILTKEVKKFRESFTEEVQGLLDDQRRTLDDMREKALLLFAQKTEERLAMAETCRNVRNNDIAPLRSRLTAYGESLQPLFEKTPDELEEVDCERA